MKQKLRHEAPLINQAPEMKNQAPEGPSQVQETQKGRSMVEMLGVLAIIGVLSIGGIVGYTQAMNRYKVNEIVDTTSKLYILAHAKCAAKTRSNNDDIRVSLSDLDITEPVAGCVSEIEGYMNCHPNHPQEKIVHFSAKGCADSGLFSAFQSTLPPASYPWWHAYNNENSWIFSYSPDFF